MPRRGQAIPITQEWKDRVRRRIEEMQISQNELARRVGVAPSAISAALAPSSKQTTVMRQIHRALEWPPPPDAITPDALEMLRVLEQLSERDQGELLGRAKEMLAAQTRPRMKR